jgi:hypothetical protein
VFGDHLVRAAAPRRSCAGVDVHHRERQPPGANALMGQVQHHDGVLAALEQQHRPLELGGHLADDVDASASSERRWLSS